MGTVYRVGAACDSVGRRAAGAAGGRAATLIGRPSVATPPGATGPGIARYALPTTLFGRSVVRVAPLPTTVAGSRPEEPSGARWLAVVCGMIVLGAVAFTVHRLVGVSRGPGPVHATPSEQAYGRHDRGDVRLALVAAVFVIVNGLALLWVLVSLV